MGLQCGDWFLFLIFLPTVLPLPTTNRTPQERSATRLPNPSITRYMDAAVRVGNADNRFTK